MQFITREGNALVEARQGTTWAISEALDLRTRGEPTQLGIKITLSTGYCPSSKRVWILLRRIWI